MSNSVVRCTLLSSPLLCSLSYSQPRLRFLSLFPLHYWKWFIITQKKQTVIVIRRARLSHRQQHKGIFFLSANFTLHHLDIWPISWHAFGKHSVSQPISDVCHLLSSFLSFAVILYISLPSCAFVTLLWAFYSRSWFCFVIAAALSLFIDYISWYLLSPHPLRHSLFWWLLLENTVLLKFTHPLGVIMIRSFRKNREAKAILHHWNKVATQKRPNSCKWFPPRNNSPGCKPKQRKILATNVYFTSTIERAHDIYVVFPLAPSLARTRNFP